MVRSRLITLVAITILTSSCAGAQNSQRFSVPDHIAADAESPTYSEERLAALIRESVNRIRARHDLPALTHNPKLDSIARPHSVDMGDNDFFDHNNPDGETPTDRGLRHGFECKIPVEGGYYTGLAENLYYTYTYASVTRLSQAGRHSYSFDWKDERTIADEIAEGWYNSPPHRKNLLDPTSQTQGIGVFIRNDHRIYATQNLC